MSQSRIDHWVELTLRLVAMFSFATVSLIACFLFYESSSAFTNLGPRLFSDPSWHPTERSAEGSFGLFPILVGTLLVTGGAVALAAPCGVILAIFCQFYAPGPIAWVYRRAIELLAGIPSVVFGFWGLSVLVPMIGQMYPTGSSLLAGILIVGLMILPTISLVSLASLQSVPQTYLVGAVALGLGRRRVIQNVVLPWARNGIVAAVILGATRAIGETMAVVMVCGNITEIPSSLFDPVRTLTANIAMEMGDGLGMHQSALFFSGTLLLSICVLLVLLVHWLEQRSMVECSDGFR